jgi:hypothetical protein
MPKKQVITHNSINPDLLAPAVIIAPNIDMFMVCACVLFLFQ